jgi:hypothetical protein
VHSSPGGPFQLFHQFRQHFFSSFVSRCTGPRDFVNFDVGSFFTPELLCFFKVDLLSRFDCTLECVDHW